MIQLGRYQLALATALVSAGAVLAQRQETSAVRHPAIRYSVCLARRADHLVSVTIDLPAGPSERELQLPVWNALYQVRDFSRYVNWVKATDASGQSVPIQKLSKSLWRVSGAENGAQVTYEIYADQPGPYGTQLDQHHAFFNLAEILMYEVEARGWAEVIRFTDAPDGWKIATALARSSQGEFQAENYDRLVDSPVEVGTFEETDFDQGGAHYRVVVDADPSDYNIHTIERTVEGIVGAATSWMNDRPFDNYLFIYHFSRAAGSGGGMEHAHSTAIEVNTQVLEPNPLALPEVTAHEFFHLWNVKRIRPQSLEPIDYTKENYTTALWFSEGVTSTVQDYILLRAGLLDERQYLDQVASEITTLERRPAHLTQSAEESSLDAWLEKYLYYRQPERSVSYYNKGELLGVLLDLQVREASKGAASLREVFQWMNQNYAKQGRFFPDSEGVRQAAEAVSHANLQSFFDKYVAGTEEIPWDGFFGTVGLHVAQHKITAADPGFIAARNFDAPPTVLTVSPAGAAQRAGLAAGDEILEMNGRVAASDFSEELELLRPGDIVKLRVRRDGQARDVQWRLGSKEEVEFRLQDVENITPQQKARRAAWLKGESQGEARP
jgi:predicted metalloprotease with PDZ domain